MKILLVEDETSLVNLLSYYIRDKCLSGKINIGCIDYAANCKEAESLIKLNKYDLILIDLLLEDGSSECLIPLANSNGSDVKIISAMWGADKIAKNYGVELIIKPFDLESIDKILNIH